MASRPKTQTGTKRLSEAARYVVLPDGIATTGWPAVRDKAQQVGIVYDEWQAGIGKALLAKRADGLYACGIGGAQLSICRQVGKTFTIGSIIVILCVLFPGLKVIWTAHHSRTTDQTFDSMQALARRKRIAPYVKSVRKANGQQEIEFHNGSVIMFGAREQGFGRGFDAVDVLVFDEAQILTQKALDDMVPTANVSPNPLIIKMGTPPKPTDPSEAWMNGRRAALAVQAARDAGEDVDEADSLYVEFSADSDADPDDKKQWAKANPSYPHRTTAAAIKRMRIQLGEDSFRREALGIYDDDRGITRAIAADDWTATEVDQLDVTKLGDAPVKGVGISFSADGMRIAVGTAVQAGERVHVELVGTYAGALEGGLGQIADWFIEKTPTGESRWRGYSKIVLSGAVGASVLRQLLIERRVRESRIVVTNTPTFLQMTTLFDDAVRAHDISHLATGQQPLDDSIAAVERRARGRDGAWSYYTPAGGDETPVEAVLLAHWAVRTSRRRDSGKTKKKAVIM